VTEEVDLEKEKAKGCKKRVEEGTFKPGKKSGRDQLGGGKLGKKQKTARQKKRAGDRGRDDSSSGICERNRSTKYILTWETLKQSNKKDA